MSIHYTTVYRKDTGEIVSTGYFACEPEMVDINFAIRADQFGGQDHDVIDAPADPETSYVAILDGKAVVADRPELVVRTEDDKTTLVAGGEDSITLTGLPDPCEIIVDDPDPAVETQVYTVEGGGFIFMADDPGIYTVEVRRWPFLPFRIEFTAT